MAKQPSKNTIITKLSTNHTTSDIDRLISDSYLSPSYLLKLVLEIKNDHYWDFIFNSSPSSLKLNTLVKHLVTEHEATSKFLNHSHFVYNQELFEKYSFSSIGDMQVDRKKDSKTFETLFELVPEEHKFVKISPELQLDFNGMLSLKDSGLSFDLEIYHALIEYSISEDYSMRLLKFTPSLPDSQKQKIINDYIEYAEQDGFFHRGKVIGHLLEIIDIIKSPEPENDPTLCMSMLNRMKTLNIIPHNFDLKNLEKALSVESQLEMYDMTHFDTFVIGCPHSSEDKKIVDYNGCNGPHGKSSFCVDIIAYAHNAEVTGFDALNLNHWKALSNKIGAHKFTKVMDHTMCLFDAKVITYLSDTPKAGNVSSYKEKQIILHKVAQYIYDNILAQDGEIYTFVEGTYNNRVISEIDLTAYKECVQTSIDSSGIFDSIKNQEILDLIGSYCWANKNVVEALGDIMPDTILSLIHDYE